MWNETVTWPESCNHITWLDTHCLPSISGRERWRCNGAMDLLSRRPFLQMMLCLLWLAAAWLWKRSLNGEGGVKDAWLCHPALLYLSMCFSGVGALVHSGPTCGKQQQHHLSIASQGTWPQNLASCCQICLSSMRYSGNAEEKKKCPEMWGWVMVFSAWGCYKQPCTHMLYFVAGGDSCTEKPLSSTWYELTETSRKSNWLLASDSNSHSWSADITSSYIHLFIEVRCYIAKHCMAHAFMGVMFPAGRAEALCHKQGLSETSPFFFNGISGISLCY